MYAQARRRCAQVIHMFVHRQQGSSPVAWLAGSSGSARLCLRARPAGWMRGSGPGLDEIAPGRQPPDDHRRPEDRPPVHPPPARSRAARSEAAARSSTNSVAASRTCSRRARSGPAQCRTAHVLDEMRVRPADGVIRPARPRVWWQALCEDAFSFQMRSTLDSLLFVCELPADDPCRYGSFCRCRARLRLAMAAGR